MHSAKNICVLLLFLNASFLQGNVRKQYYPAAPVRDNNAFTEWLDSVNKKQHSQLSGVPRDQRDFVQTAFDQRYDFMNSLLKDGSIMFGTELNDKVQQVFEKIQSANPQVRNIAREFVFIHSSVNATNLGGGCILVNTGIIERLQNDDQLAFVLCHELAHQYENHVNDQILRNAQAATDKKLNDSIERIIKNEYKVSTRLTNLLIPGLTKKMQFSREKELVADSLGFIFFMKAGYNVNEATNCLAMLDHADEEFFAVIPDFKKYFSNDSIRFNDEWLGEGYTSSLGVFSFQKDTLEVLLKTHPDIKLRIAALKRQLGKDSSVINGKVSENDFGDLSIIASINDAQKYYINHNYSRAFFIAYELGVNHPELDYPKYLMSTILGELSLYRKNHMAGKYLELQDEEDSKIYISTLNFLWALEMKDYAALSYYMIRPCTPDYKNEFQMNALLFSSLAMGRKKEFNIMFSHYVPLDKDNEQYQYLLAASKK